MSKKATVELTDADLKRLVREIAVAAERAFRRGYQHGHLCGLCEGSFSKGATTEEVSRFRSKRDAARSVSPPGGPGYSCCGIERLDMETGDLDALQGLLRLSRGEA